MCPPTNFAGTGAKSQTQCSFLSGTPPSKARLNHRLAALVGVRGVPGAPGSTSESAPTVARPFLFKPATGSRHVAGRRQNVSESRRIPQAPEREEKQGLQVETGEQRPKK